VRLGEVAQEYDVGLAGIGDFPLLLDALAFDAVVDIVEQFFGVAGCL
jgi:hypothetical protein